MNVIYCDWNFEEKHLKADVIFDCLDCRNDIDAFRMRGEILELFLSHRGYTHHHVRSNSLSLKGSFGLTYYLADDNCVSHFDHLVLSGNASKGDCISFPSSIRDVYIGSKDADDHRKIVFHHHKILRTIMNSGHRYAFIRMNFSFPNAYTDDYYLISPDALQSSYKLGSKL